MKEKKLLPEYLGLPVILGCSSESLEVGKVVESSEAKKALELLRLSARSFLQMRFQIREIDVSERLLPAGDRKNHSRVTFGLTISKRNCAAGTISRLLRRFKTGTGDVKLACATKYPGDIRAEAGRSD